MRIALLTYYLLFFAAAFLWPTWRLWRLERRNALVLPFDDSAAGVVSQGFRLLIVAIFVWLCAALLTPADWFGPLVLLERAPVRYVGVATLAVSLVLIVLAQRRMGKSWRIGIDRSEAPTLVRQGLFARSRNPIFLAMRLNLLGLFLTAPNAVTLAVLAAGEVLMQVQVRLEEDFLGRSLGEAYADYRRLTPRWL